MLGPRLRITYNSAKLLAHHVQGFSGKDVVVLHETVSGDAPGLSDITAVENYLASKDYGIHGMTDEEGNVAWALGLGDAIFWQAGGVNSRSIGIEQVSRVMRDAKTNAGRRILWNRRKKQLRATAKMIACIARSHPAVKLVYSDGDHPGVTSHWDVSQHHPESEGHTDCWPTHKGGYFPILYVIRWARVYRRLGYHFSRGI